MVEVHLGKRKEMRNAEEDKAKELGTSIDPKAVVTSPKSKTTAENALHIAKGTKHRREEVVTVSTCVAMPLNRTDSFAADSVWRRT